jgi:periplasmic divalent cation tolerance protein
MKPVIVLTTVGADFDARELARVLVDLRYAACVNIIPRIESVYRWEGNVAVDGEQLLLIKTSDERVPAVRAELLRRHPYTVPEFIVLAIAELSDSYGAWLLESVT